ncbi:hypothetical protein [Nocardia brasiliensis]|uniref:hypothetical protein n=1 Tax=Nocardia brasiliensis TaxID=37326 RepID=UPI002453DD10|nr:hypothetical protein [Nocardia brasiliensis]
MRIVEGLQAEWDRSLLGSSPRRQRSARLAQDLDTAMRSGTYRHPSGPIPLRPILITAVTARLFESLSRRLLLLIERFCEARAHSPWELADLVGYQHPAVSMLTDDPAWNTSAMAMARPDIVISGGVPRFVEVNITSGMAGPEPLARLNRFFVNTIPTDLTSLDAVDLAVPETLAGRRKVVLTAAKSHGWQTPRVCLLGWSREGLGSREYFAEVIDDFRAHDVPCDFAIPNELRFSGTTLSHCGQVIDVALRMFAYAGPEDAKLDMSALLHAMRTGTTITLSPEISNLYSSKIILAWLSESVESLSGEDRELVENHIPWTRVVADIEVSRHGHSVQLLDLLISRRKEFVLKPFNQLRGIGVIVGRDTTKYAWRRAVISAATSGGYVVQEFLPADPIEVPVYRSLSGTVEMTQAASVFSPILFGGELSGVLVRHTDSPYTSMVNIGSGVINTAWFASS